jgi:hypothetical protein
MKYLATFLADGRAENSGVPSLQGTDKTDRTPLGGGLDPSNRELSPSEVPTKPTKPPLSPTDETDETGPTFLAERWGPALEDDAPSIDIPRDWRWDVAGWPHEQWVEWRHRAAELQPSNPTAEQIRAAEHLAYVEMTRPKLTEARS